MNIKVFVLLCLCPFSVIAQGFSGLGTDAKGFAAPQSQYLFTFPKDHGAHSDYRIEWWYLTANLNGLDGTAYGLQWTLFRTALAAGEGEGWQSPQLWIGHAAVTSSDMHLATERFARGGIDQAGVQTAPFHAWIDEWSLKGSKFENLTLTANGPDFAYIMTLDATGPLVFHGTNGFSIKSAEGQASYYYSQPFFEINGIITLPTGQVPVTGNAWLDHEWSSQPLSKTQSGWDWFSLSFDNGSKLMGFQLRQKNNQAFTSATYIGSDGVIKTYEGGNFTAQPLKLTSVANRKIPIEWHIKLADQDIDLIVSALNPDAWMDLSIPYWEGPVILNGSHNGKGYLEMTGYE
ncbi:MAG: iron ABC transporter permease [Alphaproteobacteria bacterium]|nr:iron ABC transporter permease [Alphaproteobacteria bacterium]